MLESADTVDIGDTTLAYVERGVGEPVVFVHGAFSDLRAWEHQVAGLSDSYRAISYSCRYAVPNAPVGDGVPPQIPMHVDDLTKMLQALDAAPAHLVGNSSGALFSLLLALKRPELVRSLGLEEPPAVSMFVDTPPRLGELLALFLRYPRTAAGIATFGLGVMERTRRACAAGDDDAALRHFVKGVTAKSFSDLSEPRQTQARENYKWLKSIILSGEPFPRIDHDEVRNLSKPVLLVEGENSPFYFRCLIDRLEELLPMAERVRISRASHLMHEDNPMDTNEAIRAFLDQHSV
jgi:pimeloyl-ACP methyl ester carboxylesterase